jgi:hypothetical protein
MDTGKIKFLEEHLGPWYGAFNNAPVAQNNKMMELLEIYDETELGQRSNAGSIENYNMFKAYFPVNTYDTLSAYFNSVYSGEYNIMMADPPEAWALSREKRKGVQKLFPMTPLDIHERIAAWPRALFSYIYKTGRMDLLDSGLINLTFPSMVRFIQSGDGQLPCGYASGIVSRFGAEKFGLNLIPPQTVLDRLPGDLSRKSWNKRFKTILMQSKGRAIGSIKGEVNAILNFGKYVKSQYKKPPKHIWSISAIVCFNGAGIHTKYKVPLRELYGDCAILESFEIAEGALGQQLDESPYLVPNYDLYFYEIETEAGVKPLDSMTVGETGSLIVSSSVLPRLKVGDIIQCMEPNKFIILARDKPLSKVKVSMFGPGSPLITQRDIW